MQELPAPRLSNINFSEFCRSGAFFQLQLSSKNPQTSLQYTHCQDLKSKVCQIQKQGVFFFLEATELDMPFEETWTLNFIFQ